MKKFWVILAAAALIFAGCDDSEDYADVYLTSFGFRAANNSVLSSDAIVTVAQDETVIDIVLPGAVEDAAMTSLVPYFTYSNIDEDVTVTINGSTATSGVSSFNFSSAVTVVVATAHKSSTYTVNVGHYAPIYITSFGFKAEDNEFLYDDYVVDIEKGTYSVEFELPYGVSSENLMAMVPVFEVSDASASVTVGGTAVVSGETAADFFDPVTVTIQNDNVSSDYTVSVTVKKPASFAKYAESEFLSWDYAMTMNKNDGKPYFIATAYDSESSNRVPYVLYLNDGSIVNYNSSAIAEGQVSNMAISAGADGAIYTSFADGSSSAKLSAVRVTSSSADVLGERNIITRANSSAHAGIVAFSASDVWSLSHVNLSSGVGSVSRRGLNAAHFDGTAWTEAQTVGTRSGTEYTYGIVAKMIDGTAYLMVENQSSLSYAFYKYDADKAAWVDYPGYFTPKDGNGAETTTVYMSYDCTDFDVAPDGTVYVMTAYPYSSDLYQYTILKLDTETGETQVVGGGPAFGTRENTDIAKARYASMALDPNGVIYVVVGNTFAETNGVYSPAMITYLDAETKVWSDPVAVSDNVQVETVRLGFSEDGTGYVSYRDCDSHKIVVWKTVSE